MRSMPRLDAVSSSGGAEIARRRSLIIARRRMGRGVFESVTDLQHAFRRYIKQHNKKAKPVVWTKPIKTILAKLRRLPASIG